MQTRPIVIFTADDFGASPEINRAVILAHQKGVLTSASLMVGGAAANEAVELAKQNPSLAVGLHLALTACKPVLPASKLTHVVDLDGNLPRDPLRAGLLYARSAAARREIADEVRAQFDRFAATGVPLSHVDGHMHMHVHPAVFTLAVQLAAQFGADGVRLPRDSILGAAGGGWSGRLDRISRVASLSLVSRSCTGPARSGGLRFVHRIYGISRSGKMDLDYVSKSLEQLDVESAEFVFHPADGGTQDPLGPNRGDLQTLLNPLLRSILDRRKLLQGTYRLLKSEISA